MSDLFLDRNRAFNCLQDVISLWSQFRGVEFDQKCIHFADLYSWLNSQTISGTEKVTYSFLKKMTYLTSFLFSRWIRVGQIHVDQLSVPNRPVLSRVSWTFTSNQKDCTGTTGQNTFCVWVVTFFTVLKTHRWGLDLIRLSVWGAKGRFKPIKAKPLLVVCF